MNYSPSIPILMPSFGIAHTALEQAKCISIQLDGVNSWADNIKDRLEAIEEETTKQNKENKVVIEQYVAKTEQAVTELTKRNNLLIEQNKLLSETITKMGKTIDSHTRTIDNIIDFLEDATTNISKQLSSISNNLGIENIKIEKLIL